MMRYRILSRLGIWWTGIYQDGEPVDMWMRQTPIRRVLNHIWGWWNNWRYGDPAGDFAGAKSDGDDWPFYLLFRRESDVLKGKLNDEWAGDYDGYPR